MTTWPEVVTTALLGTSRRPLPDELPSWAEALGPVDGAERVDIEQRLLDLAAAHAVAAKAGRLPQPRGVEPAGATAAPAQRLPFPPLDARRMLDALLSRPEPTAINVWLIACGRHGYGVVPEHWAPLAGLAARSTTYDRAALAIAFGERGRWFVHQNPDWQRLADALDNTGTRLDAGEPSIAAAVRTPAEVERDPELLLSVPAPWPDRLLAAAVAGLVGGRLGSQTRTYARTVGRRLTAAQYAALGGAAQRFLELPHLTPASRRAVRGLFVEIERVAYDRIEIERAFDSSAGRVVRVSIPPV